MADITRLRMTRPEGFAQYQSFQATPLYIKHKAQEDRLAILVCQIKIWQAKNEKWFDIPDADSVNCLVIRECASVEVTDSAKELINKAVVRFPRGTVMRRKIEKDFGLKAATDGGDLITVETATDKDGVSNTPIAVNYDSKGLIDFNRSKDEAALLSPNDVAIDNRIEIRLGYAYSDTEFRKMNSMDHKDDSNGMSLVFTGFITSISVDTPLELECTNMAHILTTISTPDINLKNSLSAKDFLDDDGQLHLLKGTGIELAESSKKSEINVQGGSITHNLTVADVLTEWNKSGVLCMMENSQDGKSRLKIGLTYYAGKGVNDLPNNDKKYITYNGGNNTVPIVQFDWDVARDGLSLKNVDKKYLAVKATGKTKDGNFFSLTVRKQPNSDDDGWEVSESGEFDVLNNRDPRPKKKTKWKGKGKTQTVEVPGQTVVGKKQNPADLSKYMVVSYQSVTQGLTKETLIEEAKQFWAAYTPNGISGSITIFGDLFVKPTDIVGLVDMRQPEKNGYYYVESVNTTFGMDGYRRELKMPHKIASFKGKVIMI